MMSLSGYKKEDETELNKPTAETPFNVTRKYFAFKTEVACKYEKIDFPAWRQSVSTCKLVD